MLDRLTHDADHSAPDARALRQSVEGAGTAAKRIENTAQGTLRRTANLLFKVLGQFPFHVAALISVPAVALWLAIGGGVNFYRALWTSFANNEPLGIVAALVAATYALLGTLTVSWMRECMSRENRDDRADKQLLHSTADAAKSLTLAETTAIRIRDLGYQLDEIGETLANISVNNRPMTLTRKNRKEVWGRYAPDSHYYAVAAQCRFDVTSECRVDGTTKLVANVERLRESWLPRFTPETALSRVTYVLFTNHTDGAPSPETIDPIRYHLTAFRALQRIAAHDGVKLLLDRARFVLRKAGNPPKAFFVGEYAVNGVRVPFAHSYTDNAAMFGIPHCLLDDHVETTFVPDIVAAYRHTALVLTSGLPTYTLAELEARYGHLIEQPQLDLGPTVRRGRRAVSITPDVIDFGDGHFSIR
jgi:hypothetical protein